jgi:hypothetical protein
MPLAFKHLNQFRGKAQVSMADPLLSIIARMQLRKRSRHIHISSNHGSEKTRNVLSPIFWWTTDPIPKMNATGLR